MVADPGLTPSLVLLVVALAVAVAWWPHLLVRSPRRSPREAVVLYPVRHRSETTMRRDLAALGGRRVLAVTDHDDARTIAALRRLHHEFPSLDVLVAPDPTDPSWSAAWRAWLVNAEAWREPRSGRTLPPPQRRQVVYGYHHVEAGGRAVIDRVHAAGT